MIHEKLDGLMTPVEKIARVANAGLIAATAPQTAPSGAISLDNADGTRTIIGEVVNGEDNPSYTMATHVGDTTPPGVPTGITATSKSGVVVVEWDGTLDGGIPDDFFCVRVYLDGAELGALTEAGSVASAKLDGGTTVSVTATSEDDCCLPDGTPDHNVSAASQAISITVTSSAAEVIVDVEDEIQGIEQEITDFKGNTYTKAETDKKVQDLDDEISTELTTNYYNRTQIDTTYATKTLVSQTKDAIELSASQRYANKGAGNPNVTPLTAHDMTDRYNATTNPDGYWRADLSWAENISDGWAHVELAPATGTRWGQQFQTVLLPDLKPSTRYTLLMEYRNVSVTGTLTAWHLYAFTDQFVYPPETTAFTVDQDMVVRAQLVTKDSFEGVTGGVDARHRLVAPSGGEGSCSYDLRLSLYENASGPEGESLPYEGAYKPYVTDQQALGKTYATNAELTVGLDGIRQEVASEYQSIDAMGAYSTTAEMNTAIQTSATGIEQSVAATYSTKQATADAIAAIQVGGRNLITLENTYNGFLNASGGLSAVDYSSPRATGWIPSEPGTQYCLQGWTDVPAGRKHWLGICFYDSAKALIGSRITKEGADGDGYILLKATAPDGAAYVRASWRTYLAPDARAKLEAGTTPTDYTAAPEDLVARPNLTPFGSHDLADVYDTTSNPDGYWTLFSASPYLTQLSDGWLHFERVNSTSSVVGASVQVQPMEDVGEGELLTVLIEVRNNQSTTPASTGNFDDLYVQQIANSQLWGDAVQASTLGNATDMKISANGESFEKRFTKVTDSAHVSGDYAQAFRINIRNGANQTLDFDFRLSVYRGGYEGGYVPYSIEDTTLSKTYTRSTTFKQTTTSLDGRITATEDGLAVQETLIRQYAGGVLVCKVGESVGALVNASGSFDVVAVTWSGNEPTVTGTLSTMTDSYVSLMSDQVKLAYTGEGGATVMNPDGKIALVGSIGTRTGHVWDGFSVNPKGSDPRTAEVCGSVLRVGITDYDPVLAYLTKGTVDFPMLDFANAVHLVPVELFSGSTTGTVTLSEAADNFDRLVIYYAAGGSGSGSVEVTDPNGKTFSMQGMYFASSANIVQQRFKVMSISGTSITRVSSGYINASTAGAVSVNTSENNIEVKRVLGYRNLIDPIGA